MAKKLGKIKKLNVRSQWQNEASDFTPWLAQEENIKLLGEEIGLELDVEKTEVKVGPYSADILAKNSLTDEYVVIENQLGKTDHDHLGKAITYASVLNASAIIWIATKFTEEHKKALDWLNENTSGDIAFFGVKLELWQIGDSPPAVKFNVVSWSPEIKKTSLIGPPGEISDTRKLQLEFWTNFRDKLLEKKIIPSAQTPTGKYWYNVALGKSGIYLSNIANTQGNKIGIRLIIRKGIVDKVLPKLISQKEEIEKEIGEPLIWDSNPKSVNKMVALFYEADLQKRSQWETYLDWLVIRTKKFRDAFIPRIKELK